MDKEKREFWFTIIGILLFAAIVSSFQSDTESFQAYLEGSSPTARVVSFEEVGGMDEMIVDEVDSVAIIVEDEVPTVTKSDRLIRDRSTKFKVSKRTEEVEYGFIFSGGKNGVNNRRFQEFISALKTN